MRQVAGPQQEYRYEKTHFIKVGFFCLQGWILLQFSLRSNWRPLKRKEPVLGQVQIWLRGLDSNQRPLGYEPNELPGCSTPRHQSPANTYGPQQPKKSTPRIASGQRRPIRS